MKKWKGLLAVLTLVLLLLPYVAFAGQAPTVQQKPLENGQVDTPSNVTGQQDTRGRCWFFGNLFWYQIFDFYRWVSRWSVFV